MFRWLECMYEKANRFGLAFFYFINFYGIGAEEGT
jgi:hypothetical protein